MKKVFAMVLTIFVKKKAVPVAGNKASETEEE